jgi:hypothetical protein
MWAFEDLWCRENGTDQAARHDAVEQLDAEDPSIGCAGPPGPAENNLRWNQPDVI